MLDASASRQGNQIANATRQHVILVWMEVYEDVTIEGMLTYLVGSV